MGGVSFAQQSEFYIKFIKGNVEESPEGYFTYNKGEGVSVNWSSKGKHSCTYDGETYGDVIKMENGTQAYFTSEAEATVTIVQTTSNGTGDKLKFDGKDLNANLENTTVTVDADNTCNIYEITNVAAGKHTITRSTETGLAYIKVVYTGAAMTQLGAPVITYDSATGEVTISGDENTTSFVYTTDGTDPSAENGVVYEDSPFVVEDGTIVKAIALGDDENYINSAITTVQVLLDVTSVAAPTFNVAYGTVAIACETADVTIEYSTDGENFTPYVVPVTLLEDGTIYARASRNEIVSEVSSVEVTAVPKGDATDTVVLTYSDFEVQTTGGLSTLVGKDAAEGYSITLNNSEKAWSNGGRINDNVSIKLSNGAENTLYLPEGISATRITFYSYINSVTPGRVSGWRVVGDVDDTQYKNVPMAASATSEPDVRVFPLTGEETEINFQNTGDQLCFYIVLDVLNSGSVEPVEYEEILTYTMDDENYAAKTDLAAGLGTIYFGQDKREESSIAACGFGFKCDGDVAADGTKFALLKPARALQVGDVIKIGAYATSNGGGLSLYPTRDGEPLATLTLSAKNQEQTLTYTVKEGDGLAGLSSFYVFRLATKSTYITEAHIIGVKAKEDAEYETVSISYAGYSTLYYSDKALVVPERVSAFTIIGINEQQIQRGTVYETGQTIPAGEAVVLEGAAGSYQFVIDAESTAQPTAENMLKGSDEAAETTGEGKFYKLTVKKVNGEDLVGFYYGAADGAAFTNAAHKAYLVVEEEVAAKFYVFNAETTGINTIAKVANDGQIYNLQGVRMNGDKLTKGIYVVNGKKVVIK